MTLTSTESGVSDVTELDIAPESADLVSRLQEANNRATLRASIQHSAQNTKVLDEDIAEIQDIAQVRYLKGLFEFELGSCTVSNAKGNLKRNVHFWETNGAPGFILNLIQQGYILHQLVLRIPNLSISTLSLLKRSLTSGLSQVALLKHLCLPW